VVVQYLGAKAREACQFHLGRGFASSRVGFCRVFQYYNGQTLSMDLRAETSLCLKGALFPPNSTSAFSPAVQFGSNQGRVIENPLDGLPDEGLNRLRLDAALRMRRCCVLKGLAATEVIRDSPLVSPAHRAAALPTAQPPTHQQILVLAVAPG